MEVFEAILMRRSVRKFTDKKVTDEQIDKLLNAAMAAPSACNKRPWHFYVVKNEEVLSQLKKASRFSNKNSSLIIVACGDTKRALPMQLNDYWIQDVSAAVENILLTATGLGLGTCWCGLHPMVRTVKKVRAILGAPEHHIPMALIHVGYPDEFPEARTQFEEKRVKIID